MTRHWPPTGLATGLGVATLLATAAPAAAQERGQMVLWDQHIATAMNQMLLSDQDCQRHAYQLFQRGCVENELNLDLNSDGGRTLSFLDEIVLFVDRNRRLDVDREIRRGTRFKFRAQVTTLTTDEAEIEIKLGLQF